MHIIDTPEYRKAFVQYLRRGTPIDASLKAMAEKRAATHYIWRTSGDDKVRSSHAANNGKIFAWDNPPETGHPGEDYNCRCWAEPYYGIIDESLNRVSEKVVVILEYFRRLLSTVWRWEDRHFVAHFYVGGGRPVTLEKIGHLESIRQHYEANYFDRFVRQIHNKAQRSPDGYFTDNFRNSYSFEDVLFSHGDSTMIGLFEGKITTDEVGQRVLRGTAFLRFNDRFTDPLDILESILKSLNAIPGLPEISPEDMPLWIQKISEVGGAAFPISGEWSMDLEFLIQYREK